MANSNIRTRRRVAALLRAHARTMEDWVRPVSKTKKLRFAAANEILLGVIPDRSVKAKQAWGAGQSISAALGDPDDPRILGQALSDMGHRRLVGFLRYGDGGYAFHRHYKTFARLLREAAAHLLERYDGDPRKIWNSQRDIPMVRDRLDAIPGIGPGLARMAVLMLAREYGLLGGTRARRQLDVKPDRHVTRVFQRAGLVEPRASEEDIVQAARALSPDFPARLDAPAWDIGREWCVPRKPNCPECPLTGPCPRVALASR